MKAVKTDTGLDLFMNDGTPLGFVNLNDDGMHQRDRLLEILTDHPSVGLGELRKAVSPLMREMVRQNLEAVRITRNGHQCSMDIKFNSDEG